MAGISLNRLNTPTPQSNITARVAGLTVTTPKPILGVGQATCPAVTLDWRRMVGSDVLEFDFPGIRIGVAANDEEPTGCTVFYFPERVRAAIDIRGGDPGISEYEYSHYDAICFAGGSLRGLETAAGVRAELINQHGLDCDLVSGAVVNDGFRRKNEAYPDKALGELALRRSRSNQCPLGAQGAGRNVWVGGRRDRGVGEPERAGQGAAIRVFRGVKIAAFTVINSFGAVHDRSGSVVHGNLIAQEGRRIPYLGGLENTDALHEQTSGPEGNTTLTLLATDQVLSAGALRQVGRQVHSSMARVIQPFHTIYDGDVLYMVTTGAVEQRSVDPISLGLVAAEVVWDAILSAFDSPGS